MLLLLVLVLVLVLVLLVLLVGKGVAARGGNLKRTSWRGVGRRAQRLPPDALDVLASLGRERRQP